MLRTIALALLPTLAHAGASTPDDPPADEAAEARAAAKRALAHAKSGDCVGALPDFELALRLRPAPRLHYNIAVCHHRIMAGADPGSEPHESARRAAIAAYAAYLELAPEATDKAAVEETIASLGGRPDPEKAWTIERIDPGPPLALRGEEEPRAAATDPAAVAAPPTTTTPAPTMAVPLVSRFPQGRVGVAFALGLAHMRDVAGSAVERAPQFGAILRGGGFLGPRRRINVGGEIGVYAQPVVDRARYRLLSGHIAGTFEFAHAFGRTRRFELGAGAILGVIGEGLRFRGDAPAICAANEGGSVSQRGGLLLGTRLVLSGLLGRRKNHELSLRVTPALAVLGRGKKGSEDASGDSCRDDPDAFDQAGLDGRAALVVTIDLGYAPRF